MTHVPGWNDEAELLRAPAPGDAVPAGHLYEPSSGRFADLVRYVTEEVPVGLRPFHSVRAQNGDVYDSAELAHIASTANYAAWRADDS